MDPILFELFSFVFSPLLLNLNMWNYKSEPRPDNFGKEGKSCTFLFIFTNLIIFIEARDLSKQIFYWSTRVHTRIPHAREVIDTWLYGQQNGITRTRLVWMHFWPVYKKSVKKYTSSNLRVGWRAGRLTRWLATKVLKDQNNYLKIFQKQDFFSSPLGQFNQSLARQVSGLNGVGQRGLVVEGLNPPRQKRWVGSSGPTYFVIPIYERPYSISTHPVFLISLYIYLLIISYRLSDLSFYSLLFLYLSRCATLIYKDLHEDYKLLISRSDPWIQI